MELSIEAIVYYLVVLDAAGANIAAWTGIGAKLNQRYSLFGKFLPIKRGWTLFYLVWVIWLGSALSRLGIININLF